MFASGDEEEEGVEGEGEEVEEEEEEEEGGEEVAMTRKVVRSKRMTSVALHASAKMVRCLESTAALGMSVCTMLDQAWVCAWVNGKADGHGTHPIETLVVDASPKHRDVRRLLALAQQLALLALKRRAALPRQIHLVHEQKHRGVRAEVAQPVETVAVILEVLIHLARLDVEHVDEDADVLEDSRALGGEVRVHEGVLAAAVPEVEDEVAEEADVVLLDVDGRAETRGERGGVVGAG